MDISLTYAGLTDVGKERDHNEDTFALAPDQNLFLVADGMGGHASGEVASQIAADTLVEYFEESSKQPRRIWPYRPDQNQWHQKARLEAGIKLANLRIHREASENTEQEGMGTTIVATYFHDNRLYLGHVGDSRIYRMRDENLVQMTEDHSLLNDYKQMKDLTEDEIENFPHKNVIVRALGMKENVQVDVSYETPVAGDTYLLCSDGLNAMVDDPSIETIMRESSDNLEECTERLVEEANRQGGNDNITVALVRIQEI